MYRKVSALLCGMLLVCSAAHANPTISYPERPIRIVVPFVAGGGGDFIARAWSDKFSDTLKQPVIIENRGGGNTVVGTDLVVKAAPDGYTLLLVSPTISTNPTLLPNLPYKTPEAFAPVGQVITYAMGVAVSSGLPINNVAELVAFAKKNPGKLTTATSGEGSATDLAAELFMAVTDTKITKIPYKGAGQGVLDVASGHVDMLFTGMSQLKPHLDSKRIKLIATSGAERLKSAPDTPTIAEQGYPGFNAVVWWGVLAPAGTPKEIVAKINEALRVSLAQPEVEKRLAVIDGVVAVSSPAEFETFLKKEIATWSKLLRPSDSNKEKK
ncbi:MAG: tripartite tricarboxylate transporter substrate binding protein [Burkholderiaceae bacterium]|nr:tripartite tricarboxylate transporter substrate binding protein [Burkholderiaceae bacterium]